MLLGNLNKKHIIETISNVENSSSKKGVERIYDIT
jgi:hypothetical protein